jgi:hypothetical protein
MPSTLFTTRLLGYLVGLVPLVALLLLFRQAVPQTLALGLATGGTVVSVWVQQAARKRYPYNFKDPGEWWALGVYAALVVGIIVLIQVYWN